MPAINYARRGSSPQPQKRRSKGKLRAIFMVALLLAGGIIFHSARSRALSDTPEITAGVAGYCMDALHGSTADHTVVRAWKCNKSAAQQWTANGTNVIRNGTCLAVAGDQTKTGSSIEQHSCTGAPGEVWLADNTGFENPNSGLCLSSPANKSGEQLVLASCHNLGQPSETWTPVTVSEDGKQIETTLNCATGSEGQHVACNAEKEWTTWQSGTPTHEALLTTYTDGTPYEEWCADFVSYVYKEAGYPFTGGEANGWDENLASNVQNMGFTMHAPSNYTPKTGDVAFFDYDGGHVEIVVSGGKHPTFIYGNSGSIDPTTGNGDMKANTIIDDGDEGQLIYYLSPQ